MLEPNEQHFILLLETNNTFRVMTQTYFHSDHYIHGIVANKQCFSDKDFQLYSLFTVCKSDLLSICCIG